MATVPGQPDNITTMHPAFRPTQADFLQAMAIIQERQRQAEEQPPDYIPDRERGGTVRRKVRAA